MIKNIAIISSSPLMMMLAKSLQAKGQKVTIFDVASKKGGAWGWHDKSHKIKKKYLPKYSNAIVPLNKKEEKFINKMNSVLKKKYKVKIRRTNKKILTHFNFKNKYIYDFSKFYDFALNNLKFSKLFVSTIEIIRSNKVKINKNLIFDKVYLPSFVGVKYIKNPLNKKTYKLDYREITSEHLFILAKKFKLKNFYYSDYFDEEFDRVKIDKVGELYTMTTRLTHKIKGIGLSKLKTRIFKFVEKKDIILTKLSKFHNYYRNIDQLKNLENATKKSNVKYVNTTQFVCGFHFLRKIL